MFFFAFTIFVLQSLDLSSAFDVQAWQSTGGSVDGLRWPENSYIEDATSADRVGMTLSGGGDRAFIASVGYLRSELLPFPAL